MVHRRRIRITKTIQVRAPVEEVFRIISNPENILKPKLMPHGNHDEDDSLIKVKSVEGITNTPIGKGSIWHFKGTFFNRIPLEYDEQITVWDPPSKLVTEQIGGGPFRAIRREHRLAPARLGSGTKATLTAEYDLPNLLRKSVGSEKDVRSLLSKSMDTALDRVKHFLEDVQN